MRTHLLLLVLLHPVLAMGQGYRTISGRVLSKGDQTPLGGASVYINHKETLPSRSKKSAIEKRAIGTTTDVDGYFSLDIPLGVEKITIRYLGYKTQRLRLSSRRHYLIYLSELSTALEGVVVTGYQKIEKRKLTGAIDRLKCRDIRQSGVSNVADLLQGQVAGVVVSPQTGSPGEIPRIRIRGTVSINGTQDPLWVVDGMPLEGNAVPDLSYRASYHVARGEHLDYREVIDELRNYSVAGLNPYDIEDVTILKDAAATAIYGARAANGVIVITTKSGKSGKMRVDFHMNSTIVQRPDFGELNLMDADQKADFELTMAKRTDLAYQAERGAVARILTASDELEAYRKGGFSALSEATRRSIDALRTHTVDWGKLLYRPAVNQKYGLRISGGGKKSDYYLSLGYCDEKGVTIGTGFKRYSLSLKNDYALSDQFKTRVTLLAAQTERESYVTGKGGFTNPSYYARHANPYYTPYTKDGSYAYDADVRGPAFADPEYVPFSFLEERENTSYELKTQSLKGIFDVNFQIASGLTASTKLGLQAHQTAGEKSAAQKSYYTRSRSATAYESVEKVISEAPPVTHRTRVHFLPKGGIIKNSNVDFFQYSWRASLRYDTQIGQKHEIQALIGSQLRKTSDKTIENTGFGYNPQTLTTKSILFPSEQHAEEYPTYSREKTKNAYASFYATASYTHNRKYTLFGSMRYDGSDLFGADPKYKYLPIWAISGAWQASEEPFLKGAKAISNLRLRASYGFQGNTDKNSSPFVVGDYKPAQLLAHQKTKIEVSSPPNRSLRWEKTENVNLGADLSLFKNKIGITFDLYARKSTDLIALKPLPLETGFEQVQMNWAQLSNSGFEISLASENIRTRYFKWTSQFTLAHNKNELDRVYTRGAEAGFSPPQQGYPIHAVFAFKTAGLDQDGYPLFWKGGQKLSTLDFFGLTKERPYDGSALSAEEFSALFTYCGDADPKYSGGMTNRISYKNFDLSVSAYFSLKQIRRKPPPYGFDVDQGSNHSTDILRAWSPDHTTGDLPVYKGRDPDFGEWGTAAFSKYVWYRYLSKQEFYKLPLLDMWVHPMSWLRISSIRLGWTLPQSLVEKLNIERCRLSVEATNPFVIGSDYGGYFDPETYGSRYAQPIPKSLSLGLSVSF
ncbi:MAG: SusC/RagA family TonB-linked outer membrane protein [Flavobacteriales bacterium]